MDVSVSRFTLEDANVVRHSIAVRIGLVANAGISSVPVVHEPLLVEWLGVEQGQHILSGVHVLLGSLIATLDRRNNAKGLGETAQAIASLAALLLGLGVGRHGSLAFGTHVAGHIVIQFVSRAVYGGQCILSHADCLIAIGVGIGHAMQRQQWINATELRQAMGK